MIKIEEMAPPEIKRLLERVGYGHLGCVRNNRPYVVPIQYVYSEPNIYIFTTEGLKSQMIEANPEICLQVEEVQDNQHWQSVIVNGRVSRLTSDSDRALAMTFINQPNPALTPALHEKWIGPWSRETIAAIYRVHPEFMTGRKTAAA